MPEVVHCRLCGKPIRVENFRDQMSKIRRHYKEHHPKAFKESIEKAKEARAKLLKKGRRRNANS